jgi:SAM-dependent methyltransferase
MPMNGGSSDPPEMPEGPSIRSGPPDDVAPFQFRFGSLIANDPRVRGRVLDIGCGAGLHRSLEFINTTSSQVDGVEPGEDIERNRTITMRWHAPLEKATIPERAYDLAVAYNVVEHVSNPAAFLASVHRILKPGGRFWALTPNSRHIFSTLSRAAEVAGLKDAIAARNRSVNDYPAYYRMNSRRQLQRAITSIPLRITHAECVTASGWYKVYFPRWLHWTGHLYDTLVGEPFESRRVIFIFCLERYD